MRVLVVSHHYPPDGVAGVERITEALGQELTGCGDTVSIATRRFAPSAPLNTLTEQPSDGITVYRFTGGDFSNETFLNRHAELEGLFEQVLNETQPEVVHILHLRGHSPRYIELAHRTRAAVVLSLQDFYFACPRIVLLKTTGEPCAGPEGGRACAQTCFAAEGAQARRWELRAEYFESLLPQADRIICPSDYVANFFSAHGAAAERVRVIPNGVSLPPAKLWFDPTWHKRDATLKLVYLGTVLPHKGIHLILDALQQAKLEAVDLVVGGWAEDRAYVNRLRERAAQIPGLRLRFYGSYDVSELPLLLYGVDCVVTPSVWPEAFGIVTREALQEGIPVIVSRVGGLAEAVTPGKNGFTFVPEHPEELAVLFRRLTDEPELLPALRAGARATKIMTNTEHAAAVRRVYIEARQAFLGTPAPFAAPALPQLFDAVTAAGFGTPN